MWRTAQKASPSFQLLLKLVMSMFCITNKQTWQTSYKPPGFYQKTKNVGLSFSTFKTRLEKVSIWNTRFKSWNVCNSAWYIQWNISPLCKIYSSSCGIKWIRFPVHSFSHNLFYALKNKITCFRSISTHVHNVLTSTFHRNMWHKSRETQPPRHPSLGKSS